jgi:hypothetical protein
MRDKAPSKAKPGVEAKSRRRCRHTEQSQPKFGDGGGFLSQIA